MNQVTMRDMFKAGVHFGHQVRYGNPKMFPYIYGSYSKIHIINLDETLPLFNSLLKFIAGVAENRGKILFVGTKPAAREILKKEAIRCGMPYVDQRWLGGMLTNYKTIRQSIKRLKHFEELVQDEAYVNNLTKKELLNLNREKAKLTSCLNGIKNMGSLPDALFIVDVKHESTAVQEAKRLGIPTGGVVDTNASPKFIDHMVPGNDDSMSAIQLYCQAVAETIIKFRGVIPDEDTPKKTEESKPKTTRPVKVKKIVTKALSAEKLLGESSDSDQESSQGEVKTGKNVSITASMVKTLRERTGVGIMECKEALIKSNGDVEKAIDIMRKQGQAKAVKRASRVAAEGQVVLAVSEDRKQACMLEVNCETDFVARDHDFQSFVKQVLDSGLSNDTENVSDLLQTTPIDDSSCSLEEIRAELVSKIGENIQLRRVAKLSSKGSIGCYCHSNRIGVLVSLDKDLPDLAKDLAIHVAASNPSAIDKDSVPLSLIEKEREILIEQSKKEKKPEHLIEKMVKGRLEKFLKEICLLDQSFVKDESQTVRDLLKAHEASVLSYLRFELGEGIQKETVDFATEVKAQVKGTT